MVAGLGGPSGSMSSHGNEWQLATHDIEYLLMVVRPSRKNEAVIL